MMKEIWREHKSGLLVSNLGRVFIPETRGHSCHYTYGNNSKGYLNLRYKYKYYLVHRLVAECFIPNPYNLPQVNHKDENPSNNKVENLEWCDAKYNINYGERNKRVSKKQINDKNKSKIILQYDLNGNFIREWPSTMEIQRKLGYNHSHIVKCCKGKFKTAHGFIWKYKNRIR